EQLIRQVLDGIGSARVVVLDGHRLGRIDPPTISLLVALASGIAASDRVLVTAGFPVVHSGAVDLGGTMAADVDDALEWGEESGLADAIPAGRRAELPLGAQELLRGVTTEELSAIEAVVEHLELPIGEFLAHEGDASDCVYFLLCGRVSVRLGRDDGSSG